MARQTLHGTASGCKSINGYLSAMGHHPKCPHAKEPIQRPTGDYRTSGTTSLATP